MNRTWDGFSQVWSCASACLAIGIAAVGYGSAASAASNAMIAQPVGEAPRNGMIAGSWTSGNKQVFGTSYESYDSSNKYSAESSTAPISKVWFTGTQGVLSEVYWPTIDTPQVRDSQFLVTDGRSFFFEERRDSISKIEWLQAGVPIYRITNSDRDNKFVIERTVFTDPDSDAVVQKIRILRNVPGLRFFVLHNPQASNTPMGNSARVSSGAAPGPGLFAWQEKHAQALVSSLPFRQVSTGFVGASDGYQDLRDNLRMDNRFETATYGNVAVMGWVDVPETSGLTEFTLSLGFGETIEQAYGVASAVIRKDLASVQDKYVSQWKQYQQSVLDLGGVSQDGGTLFRSSVAVLKSMEDKTYEGGFVASPSVPWGEHTHDNNASVYQNGSRAHLKNGYHVVWPRDLYMMATTFLAIKDPKSAVASLNFLKRVQYTKQAGSWNYGFRKRSKDGSWPQNVWLNGEHFWKELQMDETAFPVILTHRLWKENVVQAADYWDMVRRAADFIQEFGPWSLMERWEEAMGASPSTIATEIAALWGAAEIAESMGDLDRARRYRSTADAWSSKPGDNVTTWTFTRTGGLGNGKYYIRVSGANGPEAVWNPNTEDEIDLANEAGRKRMKDVFDGGFLELVRLGVRPALDHYILESLPEMDASVRVNLPGIGPGFRRYTHDRYNYDERTGDRAPGMPWPLLTGERAHYELQRAIELGLSPSERDRVVDPYIQTLERMATPTYMIPEQVMDSGPRMGDSTGCATPLGWSHAEYIKLLRSRNDRKVFDRMDWVGVSTQAEPADFPVETN